MYDNLIFNIFNFIQAVLYTLILCTIGLAPDMIYSYYGGANETVHYLMRGIGFIMVLFLIVWVCNRENS